MDSDNSNNRNTNENKPKGHYLDPFKRWGFINPKVHIFDLTEGEQAMFYAGIDNIHTDRNKIEKYASSTVDDLLVFKGNNEDSVILWCFNNWSEPLLLARYLPDSVTLVAAMSAHQLTQKNNWNLKTRFHEHLVSRYLTTLETQGLISERLVIGGNCQGAPVAESLAVRIKNQTGNQPKLITLDYTLRKKYSGKTLMLFGKESSYNPFNSNTDPLTVWQNQPGQWHYEFLSASHGQYFKEPAITELSQVLSGV